MGLMKAWTARAACALQEALRLSNERFAERLGIHPRTVAAWHKKPDLKPNSEMQSLLDTALERATQQVQDRFAELVSAFIDVSTDTSTARLRYPTCWLRTRTSPTQQPSKLGNNSSSSLAR